MVLKIRLRQQGRTNHVTYRLVVTDSRHRRDGKYVEKVGDYDPYLERGQDITVDEDRIRYWIDQGVQLSEKVEKLIARASPVIINIIREKKRLKKVSKKGER